MSNQKNEYAFESYVEQMLNSNDWITLDKLNWDKERAIFADQVVDFIMKSQPKSWDTIFNLHGEDAKTNIITALCKELDNKSMLTVLRHGFKFHGKNFRVAYFKPAHKLSPDVEQLYKMNTLYVSRQIQCHPFDNCELDMLLSLNGLPLASIELKNPATGQTYKNAIWQYRNERNERAPLFTFKRRALVHFAIDPEEVHMTTRLLGEKTYFLPFNRGSNPGDVKCGAGNPQHKSGYRTGYFWEDVLQKDMFIEIFASFMFIETKEEKVDNGIGGKTKIKKETMIFPRFHQLDAVKHILTKAKIEKAGNNYLIQHSAGSGKTNSISWLSHRLASLHDNDDNLIFDCVVVITDRTVLDKQLQDAIYQIEHAQGVVKPIDSNSAQLAEALIDGTKIVITTLQKFPFVLRGLLKAAGADNIDSPDEMSQTKAKAWQEAIAKRKYAVIVDEAHSSQSGESARELKSILGDIDINSDDESDWEDRLNQIVESRGKQKNISFFAFTATPKGKTLELFGRPGKSGKPEAFHTYSMRQAIQEGFILDVLKNYTPYNVYWDLVKSVEDDPQYSKKTATKKLAKYMVLHPTNIDQKTEIIIEHFKRIVKPLLNGKAKAMVVTGSRLQAVKYMNAFQKYLNDNKYFDIRTLVAFSGKVIDPETGLEYTEPGMNIDIVTGSGINEKQLPEKFDTNDYQILLVANKYQTGFDQPLLYAMYVDKRLDGVQAVQTLSRLNRCYPGKESPFVLDFVNKPEDIFAAFKPYYDSSELEKETDPYMLESLKHELDNMQIYFADEIDSFAMVFYKPVNKQNAKDHADMERFVQPAKDRYKGVSKDVQEMFYDKLSAFIKLYAFVSQIISYGDDEWEKLYSYGRFLLPHLLNHNDDSKIKPEENVLLSHYRIQKSSTLSIALDDGDDIQIKSPSAVGSGKQNEKKEPLSIIIESLNERFGTDFTDEDRLFFDQIKEKAVNNDEIIKTAVSNPFEKFELGIKKIIELLMIQRMHENDTIVTKYMDDADFQKVVLPLLAKEIYNSINRK
jgi:type I restriction enzyme R subunit